MSVYPPPNYTETIPIFNASNWGVVSSTDYITQAELDDELAPINTSISNLNASVSSINSSITSINNSIASLTSSLNSKLNIPTIYSATYSGSISSGAGYYTLTCGSIPPPNTYLIVGVLGTSSFDSNSGFVYNLAGFNNGGATNVWSSKSTGATLYYNSGSYLTNDYWNISTIQSYSTAIDTLYMYATSGGGSGSTNVNGTFYFIPLS
jgi:hypothetical protein